MKFDNTAKQLKGYIQSKPYLAFALPFANFLMWASVLVMALGVFFINMDATISTIATYLFLFSTVLVLANEDYTSLAVGFAGRALIPLLTILRFNIIGTYMPGLQNIFVTGGGTRFRTPVNFSTIIVFAIFALLAFIAFKKANPTAANKITSDIQAQAKKAGAAIQDTVDSIGTKSSETSAAPTEPATTTPPETTEE